MGNQVAMGGMLQCSFGAAPATLVVLPTTLVTATTPAANITANAPVVNIPPFGVCSSMANPTVASATAAALGVLTPMPCVPVCPAPWAPGAPTVTVGGMPALDDSSKLMCTWGGVISINAPGQMKMQVP
jgi:hypothetical protein